MVETATAVLVSRRWLEGSFQLFAGALQVGTDGAHGHFHDAGNLGIRPLFDITQHEAAAVFGFQPSQRTLERCRELFQVRAGGWCVTQ